MASDSFVIVIQARMSSSRLPGKVLLPIAGTTSLGFLVKRLSMRDKSWGVIVATSTEPGDAAIETYCKQIDVPCFRGSEHDVLARTYGAAKYMGAAIVARVTSDCPLVDPEVISQMLQLFKDERLDYLCNRLPPTFPDGLDVEIFTFAALEQAHREAQREYEREHVTPYIVERPAQFTIKNFSWHSDDSDLRVTLDYEEDYALLKELMPRLLERSWQFTTKDVVQLLRSEPSLRALNSSFVRDAKYHEQRAKELEESKP